MDYKDAVEYLRPRIKERLEREGLAWYSKVDSKEVTEKFSLPCKSLGHLYKVIAKDLGVKLDKRGSRPEALSFMLMCVKENGNVIDKTVRDRFVQAYPDVGYAPMVYAAKMRLGLAERSPNKARLEMTSPSTMFRDGEMKQVYNVLARIEKLNQKRTEVKRRLEDAQLELEDIDKEIAKYEVVTRSLDGLRSAAMRLKTEMEEDAR
jgi:hypothetical protein